MPEFSATACAPSGGAAPQVDAPGPRTPTRPQSTAAPRDVALLAVLDRHSDGPLTDQAAFRPLFALVRALFDQMS